MISNIQLATGLFVVIYEKQTVQIIANNLIEDLLIRTVAVFYVLNPNVIDVWQR